MIDSIDFKAKKYVKYFSIVLTFSFLLFLYHNIRMLLLQMSQMSQSESNTFSATFAFCLSKGSYSYISAEGKMLCATLLAARTILPFFDVNI